MRTVYFCNFGPDRSHRHEYREFVRLRDAKQFAARCEYNWEIGRLVFLPSVSAFAEKTVLDEKREKWEMQARHLGKAYAAAQLQIAARKQESSNEHD